MLSNRPYFVRAAYQWIVDSRCTPILVVDTSHPGVQVPQQYVEGHEIAFNLLPSAISDLKITNDHIEFYASFSKIVYHISASIDAITAIYAEENDEGYYPGSVNTDQPTTTKSIGTHKKHTAPFLRLVETDND